MESIHKADRYLDEAALEQAAGCLRVLAHPTRIRIVQLLLRGQYTVGELAEACDIRSHSASEHLRLMQHCGLLSAKRDGRKMYYRIAEPHLESIMNCIEDRFHSDRNEFRAGNER